MNNTNQSNDNITEQLRAIKAELRTAMNGIASKAIRESGMNYKIAFGIELPRLREIAAEFTPDRHLAQALWQENIRESKMLAIMLYPHDEFDHDLAELWIDSLMPEQAEIAQLLSMEQLCQMPQAADHAFLWIADERSMRQLCGFLTITRLMMQGAVFSPDAEAEFLDQAAATIHTSYLPLRKAVQNSLLRFAQSSEQAEAAVDKLLSNQC